jgi:hypothetical protein
VKLLTLLSRSCLTGVVAGGLLHSAPANAQTLKPCSAIIDDVGIEPGKPFRAERVTRSVRHLPTGDEVGRDYLTDVSRDSAGRLRIERREPTSLHEQESLAPSDPGGGRIAISRGDWSRNILIFDCPTGNLIQLQPGLRVARVSEKFVAAEVHPASRLYSSFFNTLGTRDLPSTIRFEDLGYQEIEGIVAHGFRTTTLGGDSDGEWKGKPLMMVEVWASDDLSATVMTVRKEAREKQESSTVLTKISRGEPEGKLFQVPEGYKVNPNKGEAPHEIEETVPAKPRP